MADRVVTDVAAEEIISGAWLDAAGFNTPESRIQIGDIILDTQTNATGNYYHQNIDAEFPTARNGCTIWIDITKYGFITLFYLFNGNTVWSKSTTSPVTFRNLNGQFDLRIPTGVVRGFEVKDLANVIIDGESDLYPGLRSPFETSSFLHKTFGFLVWGPETLETGQMSFAVHCTDYENFNFNIRGCEAIDGFGGFRSQLGNSLSYNHNGTITLRRNYRHDALSGEALYFGYTGDENNGTAKFIAIIEDNIFIRAAAESTQVQHTLAGSSMSRSINTMAATDWINPFQPFQDSNWQQVWTDGDIIMRDNISEGWGTTGLSLFGSSAFTNPNPTGSVRWVNSYFGYGGQGLGYRQANFAQGLEMHWENLFINDMNGPVTERPDQAEKGSQGYFFSLKRGSDVWKFKDITHTDDKPFFFEDLGANPEEQLGWNVVASGSLPTPNYKNLGMTVPEFRGIWHPAWFLEVKRYENINIFSVASSNGGAAILVEIYGGSFAPFTHYLVAGDNVLIYNTGIYDGLYAVASAPTETTIIINTPFLGTVTGRVGAQITYDVGQIVSVWAIGFPAKGFYKVIQQHIVAAESETPDTLPLKYEKLYWDVNGVRSDDIAYTGTPDAATGGNYPPDNVLLEDTDKYFKLGMGVGMQANDPRYSMYKWYIADNAAGTINKKLIYGAKELTFDIDDDRWTWIKRQIGRYMIGSITPVDSAENAGIEVFAPGIVIGVGSIAPILLTQSVEDAAPTDVVMVFSKIVTGTNSGFTLTGTTETTFASMSGFGTDTLTGVLATAISGTEIPLLNYSSISGDIVDVDSKPLVTFSNKVIQNNVFAVPVVESMIVNNANVNEWIVDFDIPVTNTTIAGWSFKIDGVAATITGVAGSGTAQLTFTVTEIVASGDILLASYDAITGDCVAVDGGLELASFTDASVINGVGAPKIDIVWDSGSIIPIPPNTGVNVFIVKQSTALTNLVDQNNVVTSLAIQRTAGTPGNHVTGATSSDARWDASMSAECDYTSSSITYTISGLNANEVVNLNIYSSVGVGGIMAHWLQGVKQAEFNCSVDIDAKIYIGVVANASGEITVEMDEILGTANAAINCLGIDRV